MMIQPLLNLAIEALTTKQGDQQYLAAEILSHFPTLCHHLEQQLISDDQVLVSIALEGLQSQPTTSIQTLINVLEHGFDSDVKLACIKAIQNNSHSIKAVEILISQLLSQQEYWDGDWNDTDDLKLAAAKALLPLANQLSLTQAQKLLTALKQFDLEPDLTTVLIQTLARNGLVNIEREFQSDDPAVKKKLLTISTNKALLYKHLRGHELHLSRLAYRRLSELNAREYLQDFLAGIGHRDKQIRDISVQTLHTWKYKIGVQHLSPLLDISDTSLVQLSPIYGDDVIPWLHEQIQNNQFPNRHIADMLKLMIQANLDLKVVLNHVYMQFPKLDELQQLEILEALKQSSDVELSTAFLRQSIENDHYSDSVREYLVQHLSQLLGEHSKQYYSQLLLEASTQTLLQNVEPKSEPKNTATPFSTLAALSMATKPIHHRGKRTKSVQNVSNKALALKYCSDRELLTEISKTPSALKLNPVELTHFINTCIRLNLPAATVLNEVLTRQLLTLLEANQLWQYEKLWQWLGEEWINTHLELLLSQQNLTTTESIIPYINDIERLTAYRFHHYISIKQKAWQRCFELEVISQQEFFDAIFIDPELHELFAGIELEQLGQYLIKVSEAYPERALSNFNLVLSRVN